MLFAFFRSEVEWWGGGSVPFFVSICSFVYFVLSLSVAKLITFLFVLYSESVYFVFLFSLLAW